jgi:hypothetical protein
MVIERPSEEPFAREAAEEEAQEEDLASGKLTYDDLRKRLDNTAYPYQRVCGLMGLGIV